MIYKLAESGLLTGVAQPGMIVYIKSIIVIFDGAAASDVVEITANDGDGAVQFHVIARAADDIAGATGIHIPVLNPYVKITVSSGSATVYIQT